MRYLVTILALTVLAAVATAQSTATSVSSPAAGGTMTKPLARVPSDSAPYVDAQAIEERFSTITDEDMAMLRSKKVLLCGQSHSQILDRGLIMLAKENKKYEYVGPNYHMLNYADWEARKDPPNVFAPGPFIHFGYDLSHTKLRINELDTLIRTEKYGFGQTVDAALIYEHPPFPGEFEDEDRKIDKLQADFPKIRFIYTTAVAAPNGVFNARGTYNDWMNEDLYAFGEDVRARYKGKAPLLDLEKILNNNFRYGYGIEPDYCSTSSYDPNIIDLHPSSRAGTLALTKGFLLMLRDTFRAPWPPKPLEPLTQGDWKVGADKNREPIPADLPDALAVRALLDANGLKNKKVEDVAVAKGGRIVKLYLMGLGVEHLTSSIGELTELRQIIAYGFRAPWKLPLLKTVDPAIGKCTKLEMLVVNSNELTTLPDSLVNLPKLKFLSVADNHLKNLSPAVADLVKRLDPRGFALQNEVSSSADQPKNSAGATKSH